MSIFKCKMCGGTIEFEPGATVGVCDSCGTRQTLPRLDDDKKTNLYDRANHFRRNNDFDKAMGIYEQILNGDNSDAEAYWSLVLCRYGIEYVEDPQSRKRIPTVNRAQFTPIYMDEDYKSALQYADGYQKQIYEEEAKAIDDIQKGILEISSREEPFDVFICYKETDAKGRRTPDSVLATELYHELTNEGFKVFFSRITLEDKLGIAYEPYIFAALNSAKVMVALGTKPEYFNAVWVKNEWSRYLALIKNGAKKMLIPAYRDMDPYDLPEEFSHLQAQDMSKLGFMQDLIRGIKKILSADVPKQAVKETVIAGASSASTAPLLERVFLFLEDGKWQDANIYCEKVLDIDPRNAEAYLGKLMAELQVKNRRQLSDCAQPFDSRDNYSKVLRFGDDKIEAEMRGYIKHINERKEDEERREAERINQIVEAIRVAFEEKISGKIFTSLEDEQAKVQSKINELTVLSAIFDEKQAGLNAVETEMETVAGEINRHQSRRSSLSVFAGKEKKEIDLRITELTEKTKGLEKQSEKLKDDLKGYVSKDAVNAEIIQNRNRLEAICDQIGEKKKSSLLELSFKQATEALKDKKVQEEFVKKYKSLSESNVVKMYSAMNSAEVSDTIEFGNYLQDKDGKNKMPILWRVLAKEDNKILVISDKALDCKKYNTSSDNVTWEHCSLRKWLNSIFLNAAFSEMERAQILDSRVSPYKNPKYSTNPGNTTTDKVFLLSITEAEKYFSYDEDRKCVPTEYAIAQGAYTNSSYSKGGKVTCWWWLRSPGDIQRSAAGVDSYGSVYYYGLYVYIDHDCVRPALWINLDF